MSCELGYPTWYAEGRSWIIQKGSINQGKAAWVYSFFWHLQHLFVSQCEHLHSQVCAAELLKWEGHFLVLLVLDGCTFSPGYEMLCICFKAAGGDVSPAAGPSAAFSLMWYVPSGAAVIVITIGKREFAICWIHCLWKEVRSSQRGKICFAEHCIIWNKK